MIAFKGQKKVGPSPVRSPLGGLIQNFRRASPPLSCGSPPPGKQIEIAPSKIEVAVSKIEIAVSKIEIAVTLLGRRSAETCNVLFLKENKYTLENKYTC